MFFRRLEQLHEDEAHLSVPNKDVDELLCCICAAQSAQELQDFGSALVRSLQLMRERRRDITGEEMETLMAERDTALARVRTLRSEVTLAVRSPQSSHTFCAYYIVFGCSSYFVVCCVVLC